MKATKGWQQGHLYYYLIIKYSYVFFNSSTTLTEYTCFEVYTILCNTRGKYNSMSPEVIFVWVNIGDTCSECEF